MASPWIKSEIDCNDNDKVIRLRVAMNWSEIESVGFLHRFWHEVLRRSPAGVVSALAPEVMAEVLRLPLNRYKTALVRMEEYGLLERRGQHLVVRNWLKRAGTYLRDYLYNHKPEMWAEVQRIYELTLSATNPGHPPDVLTLNSSSSDSGKGGAGGKPDDGDKPYTFDADDLPECLKTPEFIQVWPLWVAHCMGRKKNRGLNRRSARLQLKRLAEMGVERAVDAVEFSTAGQFQGIHEDEKRARPSSGVSQAEQARIAARLSRGNP